MHSADLLLTTEVLSLPTAQTGNTVTEWQAFDSTSDQLGIAHLRDAPLQRADTSLHGIPFPGNKHAFLYSQTYYVF